MTGEVAAAKPAVELAYCPVGPLVVCCAAKGSEQNKSPCMRAGRRLSPIIGTPVLRFPGPSYGPDFFCALRTKRHYKWGK